MSVNEKKKVRLSKCLLFSFQSKNNDNHGQQQSSEAPPPAKKKKRNRLLDLRTLKAKLEAYIAKLPVLGFNSGTYDLNAAGVAGV